MDEVEIRPGRIPSRTGCPPRSPRRSTPCAAPSGLLRPCGHVAGTGPPCPERIRSPRAAPNSSLSAKRSCIPTQIPRTPP
jgi:hypothetical protein